MHCPAWVDAWFRVHVALWMVLAALAYGAVAAVIPNPVFGRSVPPTAASIAIWLLSAPLMGIIGATYSAPRAPATTPILLLGPDGAGQHRRATAPVDDERATWLGGAWA
jgi:hypothetical protein